MGIVRNPANTMRRGRVGETTYYISGGQQIARQALNGSNFGESARRSEAQQKRRVLWANLVNFYKASRAWMPKAFETKKRNQSDYNKFMQVNINASKVALTKSEAQSGAVIIADYIVSQGSLPTIDITKVGEGWVTNIAIGNLAIDDETTVAQFSQALVAYNANCKYGQQLSFVSYQQTQDVLGTPRCTCRLYEVTLDQYSTALLRDYLPDFCSTSSGNYLGTSTNISIGGFAYIISELSNGGLLVSTQQLVTNNASMLIKYTSDRQLEDAITSYGVDNEVILSPAGTVSQDPEGQPLYIASVSVNGFIYRGGDWFGKMSSLKGKQVTFSLSIVPDASMASASALGVGGVTLDSNEVSITGKAITVTMDNNLPSDVLLQSLSLSLDDEQQIFINFNTSDTGGDL